MAFERFPVTIRKSNRSLFQLAPSMPRTDETGCGFWLTPNTMDCLAPRTEEALERQYRNNREGRTTHSTLREQVKYPPPNQMWPTPAARDKAGISGSGRQERKGYPADTLPNAVHIAEGRMWPTPRQFMHKDSKKDRGKGNLESLCLLS